MSSNFLMMRSGYNLDLVQKSDFNDGSMMTTDVKYVQEMAIDYIGEMKSENMGGYGRGIGEI